MENVQTLERLIRQNERMPSRDHQITGALQLIKAPVFALFDEVGCGKSKQIVDAAQLLYTYRYIDTMVMIAPGFARSTWAEADPLLGEVAKHAWTTVPNVVHEYCRHYTNLDLSHPALHWVVTNFEFIRRDKRQLALMRQLRGRKIWLVVDESWAVKNFSDQMMAVRRFRRQCADRCTLLNGTPLADGKPTDLYYQFDILAPEIIGCKNKAEFKARYVEYGGEEGRKIVGYRNLEDLNKRIAPFVLARKTRDCFDLPPMLPPVTLTAPLSTKSWELYRQMRDDMVAWLDGNPTISKQAIVKALRLTQITSGYLGGFEQDYDANDEVPADIVHPSKKNPFAIDTSTMPDWLRARSPVDASTQAPLPLSKTQAGQTLPFQTTQEIGREKLDVLLKWLEQQRLERVLVWCIFRRELERTGRELAAYFSDVYFLKGGQKEEDRKAAKLSMAPGSNSKSAVVGNPKAGGASLNFAGTNVAAYLSSGPRLLERTQSVGRIERPGATQPMLIVDVIATGPKGQQTIDHKIAKSLRAKDDMAQWTVQQWRDALDDE